MVTLNLLDADVGELTGKTSEMMMTASRQIDGRKDRRKNIK